MPMGVNYYEINDKFPYIYLYSCLQNQATIAVAEESKSLFDGFLVGFLHEVLTCKSANQHKERAFRKVKIGKKCINAGKLITRVYENISFP